MKRFKGTYVLVLMIAAMFAINMVAHASNFDAWLKASELGPYAPEEEDWDAVYEAAKEEGKVVIYASSSRVFGAAETFEKAYPGIKVEAYNISGVEMYEKTEREHMAKIHNADVLMNGDIMRSARDMLESEMIVNYVPPELKSVVPEFFRDPLLSCRLDSVVLAYSDVAYDEPPIESIWELTLPEWQGGLVIRDPMRASGSMFWLTMFVKNHEAVAEDYERVFGEPIELTTPNAGYELIKRLLDNGMKLEPSSKAVLDNVTAHELARPPIGATTSSKYRDVLEGEYQFEILWDLTPSAGYVNATALAVVGYAPHPNAAKLLVNWLMGGGDEDHIGFEPWNVPGNFPVRTDMEVPAPFKPVEEYNYWYWYEIDGDEAYDLNVEMMDFWLTHM